MLLRLVWSCTGAKTTSPLHCHRRGRAGAGAGTAAALMWSGHKDWALAPLHQLSCDRSAATPSLWDMSLGQSYSDHRILCVSWIDIQLKWWIIKQAPVWAPAASSQAYCLGIHIFQNKFWHGAWKPPSLNMDRLVFYTLIIRIDKFALLWGEAQLCLPYVCL